MQATAGPVAADLWRGRQAAPTTTVVAWSVASTSFLLAVIGVVIAVVWSTPTLPHSVLVATLYPTIGALIVARQRGNAVGWMLLGIGFVNGLVALSNPWAPIALDLAPGALPGGRAGGQIAAWLADGIWILSHGTLVTLVPLLFPDGRLPSRPWVPVLIFNLVAVAVQFAAPLSVASQIGLRHSYYEFYPDERLATRLGELGYDLVRVGGVLAVVALVWRLSRMPRDERGPYVWFAAAAITAVALLLPMELISNEVAYEAVRVSAVTLIPVGAAVAILHRRAYGIDVVINRTVVYAVLTAGLAAVFLGSVAVVDSLLHASSTVSSVIAAAAAAVVLSPVRGYVQGLVNRLMYGRRDEPHAVSAAVGGRLEALASGPDTLTEVTQAIATGLRLPHVAVRAVASDGGRLPLASTGEAAPDAATEEVPLVVHGELVGELVVAARRGQDRLSTRDLAALREVAPIAAAAVSQVLLTADLQRARARLASALEEERRRIRRDLHDGLGPALATVVMGLEELRAVHRTDAERTERLLTDLKEQTRGAVEEIRTLVYGLRPPALDELGLRAALRQLVDGTLGRTTVRTTLEVPEELPPLSAATEVAAYRIVQEAVTNIVRHSGANKARVVLEVDDNDLTLEVSDNGRGLPQPVTAGVGLTSMRERAADVGGTISMHGSAGTVVHARLPGGWA